MATHGENEGVLARLQASVDEHTSARAEEAVRDIEEANSAVLAAVSTEGLLAITYEEIFRRIIRLNRAQRDRGRLGQAVCRLRGRAELPIAFKVESDPISRVTESVLKTPILIGEEDDIEEIKANVGWAFGTIVDSYGDPYPASVNREVRVYHAAEDEKSGVMKFDHWYTVWPKSTSAGFNNHRDEQTEAEFEHWLSTGEKLPSETARDEAAMMHALHLGETALPILRKGF